MRAFDSVAVLSRVTDFVAESVADMCQLRRVSSAFRDAVENYSRQAWARVFVACVSQPERAEVFRAFFFPLARAGNLWPVHAFVEAGIPVNLEFGDPVAEIKTWMSQPSWFIRQQNISREVPYDELVVNKPFDLCERNENRPPPDESRLRGWTPMYISVLMQAVRDAANLESPTAITALELLLRARRGSRSSVDIDECSAAFVDRRTPLALACDLGAAGVGRVLLDRGASPHAASPLTRETPLHYAAKMGRADCVALLLSCAVSTSEAAQMLRAVDENGHTALVLACRYDRAAVVRTLVSHGADVSAPCASRLLEVRDCTPLTIACKCRAADVVADLLRARDVNLRAPTGDAIWIAFTAACVRGDCDVVQIWIDHPTFDPLHRGVEAALSVTTSLAVGRLLLDAGVPPPVEWASYVRWAYVPAVASS